jgi:hypothetical protein
MEQFGKVIYSGSGALWVQHKLLLPLLQESYFGLAYGLHLNVTKSGVVA